MSAFEIGIPREDERQASAEVIATALNASRERILERSSAWRLEDMRVARVDGTIAAAASEVRFDQWFGGRPVACSGILLVGTRPEHRGRGLASEVTGALLDDARARGEALAALFPAVVPPYRRLGFEIAGVHLEHRVDLDLLPRPRAGVEPAPVEVVDPGRDIGAIRELVHRWVAEHTGPTVPRDDTWWVERWLRQPDPDFRVLAVRGPSGLEGMTTVAREPTEGPLWAQSFGLSCGPLIATTERALLGFLAYFRSHRGIGRWVGWSAPPRDPLALLLDVGQPATALRHHWMLRLLDVPGAFAARGYTAPDGEATFAVDDSRYPDNAGPWRLEVRDGVGRIEPVGGEAPTIPIGALSAMYTGFLRPADAPSLGISGPGDHERLGALLAGPDPWDPWWF